MRFEGLQIKLHSPIRLKGIHLCLNSTHAYILGIKGLLQSFNRAAVLTRPSMIHRHACVQARFTSVIPEPVLDQKAHVALKMAGSLYAWTPNTACIRKPLEACHQGWCNFAFHADQTCMGQCVMGTGFHRLGERWPTSMQLLKLQELCRVHELHMHGVCADLEAHEFAVAGPQAECHALVIGNDLHMTGGRDSCLGQSTGMVCHHYRGVWAEM